MTWLIVIGLIIVIMLLIAFFKGRGNADERVSILAETMIDCIEEIDFDLDD